MIGSLEVTHELIFTIPIVIQISSINSIRLRFNLEESSLSCQVRKMNHKLAFMARMGYRHNLVFQNEEIFVQLDEIDELDRITHIWIWLNCSLIQAQKNSLV